MKSGTENIKKMLSLKPPTPSQKPRQSTRNKKLKPEEKLKSTPKIKTSQKPRQPTKNKKLKAEEELKSTPKIKTFFQTVNRDRDVRECASSLQRRDSTDVQKIGSATPKVTTMEQDSNAVQGDVNSLKTRYQISGNPDLDASMKNQVSLSKQLDIKLQDQMNQSQD